MKRHILCLETAYDKRWENRSTMSPILELLERVDRVRHVHFSCHTTAEFGFNIQQLNSSANFKILYLATHGSAGTILLASGEKVTLENLAEMIGDRCADWTVHFGGCEVLDGGCQAARKFMDATGVSLVTGYSKPVDWIPSAALELLWFSALQGEGDVKDVWQQFREKHLGLVRFNGMKAVSASE